jgi:hypothetical protein
VLTISPASLQVPGLRTARPLPLKQRAAGPGDPWLAKLGLPGCQVKPALCTNLCIAWGEHGAPLWISRHADVN